eukprot:7680733-Pyramimonas_sp.AAC.1
MRAGTHGNFSGCSSAALHGAPRSSPGKISRPRDSLCSSGFARCQLTRRASLSKYLVPRRALRQIAKRNLGAG